MSSHLFYDRKRSQKFIYFLVPEEILSSNNISSTVIRLKTNLTINPLQRLRLLVQQPPKRNKKQQRNNNHNTCNFITLAERKTNNLWLAIIKMTLFHEGVGWGWADRSYLMHIPLIHLRFSNSSNVFWLQLRDWVWKESFHFGAGSWIIPYGRESFKNAS